MDFRTDLAFERCAMLGSGSLDGVTERDYTKGSTRVHEVTILNDKGAKSLGRPQGRYITVDIEKYISDCQLIDGRADGLIEIISSMLPKGGSILVAGIGNRNLTADSIGPLCADSIFVTRHIAGDMAKALGFDSLRSVCAIASGVMGETGIDSCECIKALCNKLNVSCVIAVDALASRSVSRLGSTIQLCDSGIAPGSGVGNSRKELSKSTLGIPVIAIGVPTVITLAAAIEDLTATKLSPDSKYSALTVASRDIDIVAQRAAKLIAFAINSAIQTQITPEEMLILM